MIPQAGSAYAYSYATLGELVAWIIGWDLILEYAVGNIAVAVAWGGYFNSLLSGVGVHLPGWLTHGYRAVSLSSDPAVQGWILARAGWRADPPQSPVVAIVMFLTWILLLRQESFARDKLMVGSISGVGSRRRRVDAPHWRTTFPCANAGEHPSGARSSSRRIGFDAISTAAEEHEPARNMPSNPWRLDHLHGPLRDRRLLRPGSFSYPD